MKKETIYTDGGCRGNPGPSSAGVYIPHLDMKLGFPLEDTTNNVAEYSALIFALRAALRLGLTDVEIKADSELMVKQMTGVYGVRSEKILPLWEHATELAALIGTSVTYTHIPRAENAVADKICNLTLDVMAKGYNSNRGGIRWKDLDNPDRQMSMLIESWF